MKKTILKPDEIGKLSRPIPTTMDKTVLEALIAEVENTCVRPVIGDAMYKYILERMDNEHPDGLVDIMLRGGWYPGKYDEAFDGTCTEACNNYFVGLKVAIAYYALAKVMKSNNLQVTRFGLVAKDGEYSSRPSSSERSDMYHECASTADRYMSEFLDYIKTYSRKYPLFKPCGKEVMNTRTKYSVIGN